MVRSLLKSVFGFPAQGGIGGDFPMDFPDYVETPEDKIIAALWRSPSFPVNLHLDTNIPLDTVEQVLEELVQAGRVSRNKQTPETPGCMVIHSIV